MVTAQLTILRGTNWILNHFNFLQQYIVRIKDEHQVASRSNWPQQAAAAVPPMAALFPMMCHILKLTMKNYFSLPDPLAQHSPPLSGSPPPSSSTSKAGSKGPQVFIFQDSAKCYGEACQRVQRTARLSRANPG